MGIKKKMYVGIRVQDWLFTDRKVTENLLIVFAKQQIVHFKINDKQKLLHFYKCLWPSIEIQINCYKILTLMNQTAGNLLCQDAKSVYFVNRNKGIFFVLFRYYMYTLIGTGMNSKMFNKLNSFYSHLHTHTLNSIALFYHF